ncbi:hypothetical protein GCM10011390_40670 [Aureimonas endophytica]|uniref:TadE-like domain-containing protein n=1 Tax=Aureimonas endophytica TaxID=2027858 RepID=A0A917E9R2_9HYPH|nr:TadE/TadG family type IV pilus assembly protein [Aureimonas endophytica]GGE17430.1 hypothetical protein GCM10011390_40670 [Aureimonas endophytica]
MLRTLCRAFRDRRAVAATEFALVLPVLILLVVGLPDLGGAILAAGRATKLAETMAQLVSQSKITLSDTDLDQILGAAPLADPEILTYARAAGVSIEKAATVIVSSVAFKPTNANCQANCQYKANVVFSRALSGAARPCGALVQGEDGSLFTLPSKVYSANSVVVVDVETHFKPFLADLLFGEMSFKRSAYFRPRYVAQIDSTRNCPGYAS